MVGCGAVRQWEAVRRCEAVWQCVGVCAAAFDSGRGSGRQCMAVRGQVCASMHAAKYSSVTVCGSAPGSERTVQRGGGAVSAAVGAAVCGSPAVSIFSNEFKTYS